MPLAAQYALLVGDQGEDMSGADEVGWEAGEIEHCPDGHYPLGGTDPGLALAMVNWDGETGLGRVYAGDHRGQIQSLGHLRRDRHAEVTSRVPGHEVDRLGGNFFGGGEEISFVLAIFGVDDDYHSAFN